MRRGRDSDRELPIPKKHVDSFLTTLYKTYINRGEIEARNEVEQFTLMDIVFLTRMVQTLDVNIFHRKDDLFNTLSKLLYQTIKSFKYRYDLFRKNVIDSDAVIEYLREELFASVILSVIYTHSIGAYRANEAHEDLFHLYKYSTNPTIRGSLMYLIYKVFIIQNKHWYQFVFDDNEDTESLIHEVYKYKPGEVYAYLNLEYYRWDKTWQISPKALEYNLPRFIHNHITTSVDVNSISIEDVNNPNMLNMYIDLIRFLRGVKPIEVLFVKFSVDNMNNLLVELAITMYHQTIISRPELDRYITNIRHRNNIHIKNLTSMIAFAKSVGITVSNTKVSLPSQAETLRKQIKTWRERGLVNIGLELGRSLLPYIYRLYGTF